MGRLCHHEHEGCADEDEGGIAAVQVDRHRFYCFHTAPLSLRVLDESNSVAKGFEALGLERCQRALQRLLRNLICSHAGGKVQLDPVLIGYVPTGEPEQIPRSQVE